MTVLFQGLKSLFSPRAWSAVLGAILLAAQLAAALAVPALAQPDAADLVLVRASSAAEYNRLVALDLAFFVQMGAADLGAVDLGAAGGGWTIVVRADAAQQAALAAAGFAGVVLEKDVPADAAGYYQLYGLPEDLVAIQKELPPGALLAVEDRQALARLAADQVPTVEAQGVHTLPVTPFKPAPVPDRAGANLLAPDLIYSPAVQGMINSLPQSKLVEYVGKLSGEEPAMIDGAPYTLSTRYTYAYQPITKATRFGYEHFSNLDLLADYDYYFINGLERRNVIAEQPGMLDPARIYMLTAHLDSRAAVESESMTFAPGADDNASGSAALMAIAEILSNYRFACTLRYALFTGEEQGLYGSSDYAGDVVRQGHNLQGVLNLDMLGYSAWGSSPTIELHTRPGNAGDLAIAYLFRDAVNTYSQPLTPLIRQDSLSFSDHSPFWNRGFPALLAIEDWSDHTPNYHRTSDQLENLNLPYYTAFARSALAAFAHMGCLLDDGLGGRVLESSTGAPLPNAQVSAWMTSQTPVSTLSNIRGDYFLGLADGTYTVKFSAPGHRSETVNNVQVVSGEAATQNRSLTVCSTLSNLAMTASSGSPNTGQEVTFQASTVGGAQPVTYTWTFGDGSSASGAQVAHTYSTAGVYPVKVAANNICDYPLEATRYLLVDVDAAFIPLLAR